MHAFLPPLLTPRTKVGQFRPPGQLCQLDHRTLRPLTDAASVKRPSVIQYPGRHNIPDSFVLQPSSRMRSASGFRLPPVVPEDRQQISRAVQLLGCFTQRSKSLHLSTKHELKTLVGDIPPNRLIAQQWKVALCRHITMPARLAHRNNVTAFKHRDALIRQLPFPNKSSEVSRMFILLEVLRKRYSTNIPVNARVISEISNTLGSCPSSTLEARRYIRALALIQSQRKRSERKPPQLPLQDLNALMTANMLLGAFAVRGSIGTQTSKLENLLGASPRTTNVANSWKKIVAAAIRKKKRTDRVRAKRQLDNEKRRQRRLKRFLRDRNLQNLRISDNDVQSHDGVFVIGEKMLRKL